MNKVHTIKQTPKSNATLMKNMTNEFKDITEPVSPGLPSPTSVILETHNKFNTRPFYSNIDANKWYKSKIIDINNNNVISIIFSTNDVDYHIWKC